MSSVRAYTKKYYQLYDEDELYEGTFDELLEQSEVSRRKLQRMIEGYYPGIYAEEVGKSYPIYDFYRVSTDEYIGTMPAFEMADFLDVQPKTLSNNKFYRREFTGKYKIVEDEEMITRRTLNKVAPVPVPEKYNGVAVKKQITVRPAAEKTFKVGEYAQYLHDSVFAKWNLKEGQ